MSTTSLNVLITGANRGIGLALAKQFKSKGHNVIGTSRNVTGDAIGELRKVATAIVPLDLNDEYSIESLLNHLTAFRQIDILVNNSGVYERDTLESVNMDTMHSSFQINTVGPLLVSKTLLPKLASNSKLIQMTSRMGSIADNSSGGSYSYRASKAALNMVNKSLALDLPNHICVALHPGYIQTRMTGGHGEMSPDLCAEKLVNLILGFDSTCSGKFFHRDGQELEW
ncbi:hypothetical protein HMI56_002029 [Coelomomyces lativittatus]|nr:hypothetical protein HMI56_002029 [Coelomomyces lativittatus]